MAITESLKEVVDVQGVQLYTPHLLCLNGKKQPDIKKKNIHRLEGVLDYLEELIYDISCKDGFNITYYGSTVDKVFGFTEPTYRALLQSGDIESRYHPDDLVKIKAAIVDIHKRKQNKRLAYRFLPNNALDYQFYEERIFPKTDDNGNLVAVNGIIRNITEFVHYEKQLEQSENSYKELFDKSVNLLFIFDKNNTVIDVNKRAQDILQIDKKHLKGESYEVFCSSEKEAEGMRKQLEQAWQVGISKAEWELRANPGQRVFLELVFNKGQYFGQEVLIANGRDISDRRLFEEQIRASNEKLDMVIQSIPEMFYNVTIIDGQKKFDFISHQIKDILGFTEAEYLDKLDDGSIFDQYHPADLESLKQIKFDPEDSNKPYIRVYRFKKKGEDNYSWVEETAYPRFDEKGKRLGTYGVIRDVTEQQESKLAIEESEARYRNLFERNFAGVFRNSVDGTVLEANDAYAHMMGYKNRNEIIGKDLGKHYPNPEDRSERIAQIKKKKIVMSERYALKRKDGKDIWLLSNIAYQENEDDSDYIEGTVIEITKQVETQQLLEKREKSYRDLIVNSPYGIVIHRKGEMLFANKRALEIAGYKKLSAVKGKSIFEFLSVQQENTIMQEYEDLKSVDSKEHIELSVKNKDGKEILIDFKAMLCIWEGERAVQVAFRDITDKLKLEEEKLKVKVIESTNKLLKKEIIERKKIEARLRENEAYTRNIISSSLDMICATDPQDKIVEFNNAAQECFGYEKEEIIGKPVSVLYAVDEERKRIMESLEETGGFQGEVINKRKNGERFITFLSGSLLYDDKGNVIGSMGVSRDITDIKSSEEKSRIQSAKLNAIVNSRSHLIWTVNRRNELVLYNEHFQKFYQSNFKKKIEMGDIPWDDLDQLLTEQEKEKIAIGYDKAFEGKEQYFEVQFKNNQGDIVWMEVYLNPISLDDRSGEVFEVSSIAQDITEKKLFEEQIQSSLKEKEVLLQEVHHRVKNNLQVISSILNLQTSYIKDEKIISILKESQNRIKSMAFIHESLYQANDFSQIDFSDYIRNLANNLVYSYRTTTDKVHLALELQPISLPLDVAIPCGLIVNELVSNALKYAFPDEKQGTLEIKLYLKKGKVHLEIADDGIGLPDGFDYTNTASLGLQLVVTLAEQLSADIGLENTKGTKFAIEFAAQQ